MWAPRTYNTPNRSIPCIFHTPRYMCPWGARPQNHDFFMIFGPMHWPAGPYRLPGQPYFWKIGLASGPVCPTGYVAPDSGPRTSQTNILKSIFLKKIFLKKNRDFWDFGDFYNNIPIRAHSSHIPTIFREKMQLFVTVTPKNDDFLVDFFGQKFRTTGPYHILGLSTFWKYGLVFGCICPMGPIVTLLGHAQSQS